MSESPTTPSSNDDAAALLDAAEKGDHAGSRLSAAAVGPIRFYSFALAVLLGAYFLALVYLLSDAEPTLVWTVTGIYLAVLAIVVIGYLRARKATAPRANRRLLIGIAVSTALFLAATVLSTFVETRTPLLWIPVTIVMMLPLVLSTFVRASR
jgi:hypothetical protein